MAEFGSLDVGDIEEENNRLGGKGAFQDQFVPIQDMKAGDSLTIRILPPIKGGKLFQYNRIHTLNDRKINCPRPLVNGKYDRNVPCPICDHYNSYWPTIDKLEKKLGKDAEEVKKLKDEARLYKPAERYYYNALVRKMLVDGETKTNVGPRVLSVGKVLHQMILRAIVSEDPQERLGDITNIKTGYDFIIRKDIRSGFPNYDRSTFARESSPLGDPELVSFVSENMIDLTKFRTIKDIEEIKKQLAIARGIIPDDTVAGASYDADQFADEMRKNHGSKTSVSVPENILTEAAVSSPSSEDLGIDSEDYLKDLADFQNE